ncbi:MAG TPA: 2-dehydropantoate 2-reductase [Solirubrobacteraceae bacterium]|jgi:2-dehydropantoate 2-reductase|nr:2-dehydropantoate 2-reductase [Solirubrobacteraceae bacterium]
MKIAILGPGGVGGLLAGALERCGVDVTVIARDSTVATIAEHGVRVSSVKYGDFVAHPTALSRLSEPVDALIVATKAAGLGPALERIDAAPAVVLPLLNGLDHLPVLRERFGAEQVLAGTIRVEADRPEPGVVVHTSPFLLIEMASRYESAAAPMRALADALTRAEVSVRADWPIAPGSEAQVMWSKLVRLNALACTTSAYDKLLGEIRDTPALRADLVGAMQEAAAAGQAEGAADVDAAKAIAELDRAHATLGSSMQRDIAAGRPPELDAIPGSVLRAASRHGLKCPTIERLVAIILARVEGLDG